MTSNPPVGRQDPCREQAPPGRRPRAGRRLLLAALTLALLLAAAGRSGAAGARVRVVDEAGKAIAGAQVVVLAFREQKHEETLRPDPDGSYPVPLSGYFTVVVATAPGYAPAGMLLTRGDTEVTLALGAPREITGKVFGPDGKPAEGVDVRVASISESSPLNRRGFSTLWVPVPDSVARLYSARTDAAGVYHLKGLPAGGVRLSLGGPRFVAEYQEVKAAPTDVRLRAGCILRGKVIGYEPRFKNWRAWTMAKGMDGATVAPLNADGTFVLSGIPPGVCLVVIITAPEDPKVVPAVRVKLDAVQPEASVVLRAVDGGVIVGRTVDAKTHAPLADVTVNYNGADGKNLIGGVKSGPDGVFRVRLVPGKAWLALARDDVEWTPTPRRIEVTVVEGREVAVEVPVRDWLTLAGTVRDTAGKPVEGALVTAQWASEWGAPQAVTNAAGAFRITGLPKRKVTVTARRGDEATAVPARLDPPFPLDLRLEIGVLPQVTLVGRVVDDSGQPAAGASVRLEHIGGSDPHQAATTDAAGRYRFVVQDLAGEYQVQPDREEPWALSGGLPMGDQGAERRFTDLVVVSSRGTVSGRVVDAGGRPAAGVTVFWPLGRKHHQVVTNAQGQFRIEGLPVRAIVLVARHPTLGTAFAPALAGQEAVLALKE